MNSKYDVAVIGAGPAGLAAAIKAREAGARTLLLDRESHLGGILHQCIHPGFGLLDFQEELTGPEYAHRLIRRTRELGVETWLESMVLNLDSGQGQLVVAAQNQLKTVEAESIVLAMGCRERTRTQIVLPGYRPAGVFTAGTAQRWLNVEGFHVGRRIVILGSGDIGLIMARRLTLEGAQVAAVVELMGYETGLKRNVVQCLEDFGIPLLLGHTVTEVHGTHRLEGVTIAAVDKNREPLAETARFWECDCLLLSVGLIPENELSRQAGVELDPLTGGPIIDQNYRTSVPGIFACGNVLHVNDLVDNVAQEGYQAGSGAAGNAQGTLETGERVVSVGAGANVRYVVPQELTIPCPRDVQLSFRVKTPIRRAEVKICQGDNLLSSFKVHRARPGEILHCTLSARDIGRGTDVVVAVEGEVTQG